MNQHYKVTKVNPTPDAARAWAVISTLVDDDDRGQADFYFSGLSEAGAKNLASEMNKMWNTIEELEHQLKKEQERECF